MYQQAVNHVLRCRFVKYELGLRKIREEPLRRALFIREDSLSNNSSTMRRYTFKSASILCCYQRNRVEGELNPSGHEWNISDVIFIRTRLVHYIITIFTASVSIVFPFRISARTCQFSSSDSFVVSRSNPIWTTDRFIANCSRKWKTDIHFHSLMRFFILI